MPPRGARAHPSRHAADGEVARQRWGLVGWLVGWQRTVLYCTRPACCLCCAALDLAGWVVGELAAGMPTTSIRVFCRFRPLNKRE
eukprot:COSAG02_NODE_19207_length_894_cov_2.202516_1_plen_84_part_01